MSDALVRDPYHIQHYPLLVVISGPSGVGKDSVVQGLRQRDYPFHFVVTATSRPRRPAEVDGVDYIFVTKEEFERMIHDDELLEYAVVYGQYKGVPRQQVREALNSGLDVVMRLDVQGAMTIKRIVPDAVLIFLSTTSEAELEKRLRQRGGDTEAQIRRRLATTEEELALLGEFNYLVHNPDQQLDLAVERVMSIIQAEHCRTRPRKVVL